MLAQYVFFSYNILYYVGMDSILDLIDKAVKLTELLVVLLMQHTSASARRSNRKRLELQHLLFERSEEYSLV